jgi:hypothetical protein
MIIVDRDSYKDLFGAPDTVLHFMHATLEDFDFRCVFRADIFNETHTDAVRFDLNRAIPAITPYIVDEVNVTMDEILDPLVTEGSSFSLF